VFGYVDGSRTSGDFVLIGPEQRGGERGLIRFADNRARLRTPLRVDGKRTGAPFGQKEIHGIRFGSVSAPMTQCFRSGRSVLGYAELITFSGK
jgi:hypothetical protein